MKPGWIRLSLHPTMTNEELIYICEAIEQTVEYAEEWKKDYSYDRHTNEFKHISFSEKFDSACSDWFKIN